MKRQGLVEVSQSFVDPVQRPQCQRPPVPRLRLAWLQRNSLVVAREGLLVAAELAQSRTAIDERGHGVGVGTGEDLGGHTPIVGPGRPPEPRATLAPRLSGTRGDP